MKTWFIATNSHPDWRKGEIHVLSRPWWLSLAEWAAFAACPSWLRFVKLPDWPIICWDFSDPEHATCSPREWYGDLGQLVHAHVTNPIFQWVWSHPKNVRTVIEVGYDRLYDLFGRIEPEVFSSRGHSPG